MKLRTQILTFSLIGLLNLASAQQYFQVSPNLTRVSEANPFELAVGTEHKKLVAFSSIYFGDGFIIQFQGACRTKSRWGGEVFNDDIDISLGLGLGKKLKLGELGINVSIGSSYQRIYMSSGMDAKVPAPRQPDYIIGNGTYIGSNFDFKGDVFPSFFTLGISHKNAPIQPFIQVSPTFMMNANYDAFDYYKFGNSNFIFGDQTYYERIYRIITTVNTSIGLFAYWKVLYLKASISQNIFSDLNPDAQIPIYPQRFQLSVGVSLNI